MVVKQKSNLTQPFFHPIEFEYTRSNGSQPIYTYEGEYKHVRPVYEQRIATNPSSMSLRRVGETPHFRLTISYAIDPETSPADTQTNPVVNTYEIEDNQLQQHSAQNLYLHSQIGGATIAKQIVDIFDNWKRGKYGEGQAYIEVQKIVTDEPQRTKALAYLDELARGGENYLNFHTVFRRTISIVDPSQIEWAAVGVKKVWTTAAMLAHEGFVGSEAAILLPTGYWLKLPPRMIGATNQRTQLTWEYWNADEFSTLLYEYYTP